MRGIRICAARASRGSSHYRPISAARALPQQQTRRPPPLLSIDRTDKQTVGQTDGRTLDRFMMKLTAYYAELVMKSFCKMLK